MSSPAPAVVLAAIVLAVSAPCVSATGAHDPTAPPATLSPLDPIRLASDFAPEVQVPVSVLPFEVADSQPIAAPADSVPPVLPRLQQDPAPSPGGESPSIVRPVVCSLLGGFVGLYGGALVGDAIGGDEGGGEWDEYGAALLGATVGEIFLMPVGAHYGNDFRGSYGSALVGSVLGFGAVVMLGTLGPAGAIVGLGLQTLLTVSGERRSAESKSAEAAAQAARGAPSP